MGQIFTRILALFVGPNPFKVIMVGLDAAGKTTILYKIKSGEVVQTIPTIGFNLETVQHKNVSFTVWDLHSQDKSRPLWRHYLVDIAAIIFVVDSKDAERFTECREVLHNLLRKDGLDNTPLLILANKQDLQEVATPDQVKEALQLSNLHQPWFVQGTSAITSTGISEALDWLAKEVTDKK